jgi:pyruvate formate lyase activating enzyme
VGSGTPLEPDRQGDRAHAAFARRLSARRRPIWIRFVLVPGLTDDAEMGKFKWERLDRDYTLEDVSPPTAEAVEQACAVWRAAGLKAL